MTAMPFEIIDDITMADAAFRARGKDRGEMFRSAAQALMSVMLKNPESISCEVEREVRMESGDTEMLLHDFLQELLFFKDSEGLLLLPRTLAVSSSHILEGVLGGERIKRGKHLFQVDVKAVTLHRFMVEERGGAWTATVVLDV